MGGGILTYVIAGAIALAVVLIIVIAVVASKKKKKKRMQGMANPFPPYERPAAFCQNCGAPVSGTKFCGSCGAKVE